MLAIIEKEEALKLLFSNKNKEQGSIYFKKGNEYLRVIDYRWIIGKGTSGLRLDEVVFYKEG